MRPKKHETTGAGGLFRARLDQIVNIKHELVRLAEEIDWEWIDDRVGNTNRRLEGAGHGAGHCGRHYLAMGRSLAAQKRRPSRCQTVAQGHCDPARSAASTGKSSARGGAGPLPSP